MHDRLQSGIQNGSTATPSRKTSGQSWPPSPTMTRRSRADFTSSGVRHRRPAGHHGRGPAPDEYPCHPLGHPGLCQCHLPLKALPLWTRGVAICMDCRHHHCMEFARAAAEVCAANASMCGFLSPCAPLRSLALPCGTTAARRESMSPPVTTPRSTTAIRSTGRTVPSCRPTMPTPSPPVWSRSTSSPA